MSHDLLVQVAYYLPKVKWTLVLFCFIISSIHYLDLPQVNLFFIPDLFITFERSEKVILSDEVGRDVTGQVKLLERTFRKSIHYYVSKIFLYISKSLL